jgi:hypothetical protein
MLDHQCHGHIQMKQIRNRTSSLWVQLYFMIKGYPPSPELDSREDRLEIASRFETGQFLTLDDVLVAML